MITGDGMALSITIQNDDDNDPKLYGSYAKKLHD